MFAELSLHTEKTSSCAVSFTRNLFKQTNYLTGVESFDGRSFIVKIKTSTHAIGLRHSVTPSRLWWRLYIFAFANNLLQNHRLCSHIIVIIIQECATNANEWKSIWYSFFDTISYIVTDGDLDFDPKPVNTYPLRMCVHQKAKAGGDESVVDKGEIDL